MKSVVHALLILTGLLAGVAASADEARAGLQLYATHCAACHGADRLGGSGPALFPENLRRLKKNAARDVIAQGRPATQMPGFAATLSAEQIAKLVEFIYQPPAIKPHWDAAAIARSHQQFVARDALVDAPAYSADPLNLFTVVETGDHHISILDGDSFSVLARFPTHFALHGGAKYSPDGRFVYLASRDGWVSQYDLWGLEKVAEVRAGINTRNIAVSGDGTVVAVGNFLPTTIVLLDARDLSLLKVIDVVGEGGTASRVSAVYSAEPRGSFIAALKDIPEVWEIEASGPDFSPRRIVLDDVLDDFFFDADYRHVIGAARNQKQGQVVDLQAGEKIAAIPLDGMPHLGSGIIFPWRGRTVMATPHLREGKVSVIDMQSWERVKTIETRGPGFFMRSHENTPYAWVDVFFGPHKDVVHVIDKRTLDIVKTLRPEPDKTLAHVEFTRDGAHALVSLWEEDGALIVYDADTLEEVERVPMRKPVGKYNVYNKITRSLGTSH